MNVIVLVRLLAAHIIGDFFLQTDTICQGKNSSGGRRLIYLAVHSGINAVLAYLFVGRWECWQIPMVVFFTHYLIDFVKSSLNTNSIWVFLIDQMAHLAVISALWLWATGSELSLKAP